MIKQNFFLGGEVVCARLWPVETGDYRYAVKEQHFNALSLLLTKISVFFIHFLNVPGGRPG